MAHGGAELLADLLEARRESLLDASCAELVSLAYDDVSPAIWPIAKLSVDAHLEKVVREGKVAAGTREGAFRVVAF